MKLSSNMHEIDLFFIKLLSLIHFIIIQNPDFFYAKNFSLCIDFYKITPSKSTVYLSKDPCIFEVNKLFFTDWPSFTSDRKR